MPSTLSNKSEKRSKKLLHGFFVKVFSYPRSLRDSPSGKEIARSPLTLQVKIRGPRRGPAGLKNRKKDFDNRRDQRKLVANLTKALSSRVEVDQIRRSFFCPLNGKQVKLDRRLKELAKPIRGVGR
jgi:hypothetical protein